MKIRPSNRTTRRVKSSRHLSAKEPG
jgi:hypothetical protein